MIADEKYCVVCGQKLNTNMLANMFHKKYFQFKDGDCCETCAREKVKHERGKMK